MLGGVARLEACGVTIGLLLGAGASFELGMPLAKHLTREITRWLTPEKLRSLNDGWRDQGGGLPDQVVNDVLGELARPGSLYEEVLGHLETQFRRMQGADRQTYHHLYSWLVELVYHLLYYRHVRNGSYIQAGLPFFEGLRGLAGQSRFCGTQRRRLSYGRQPMDSGWRRADGSRRDSSHPPCGRFHSGSLESLKVSANGALAQRPRRPGRPGQPRVPATEASWRRRPRFLVADVAQSVLVIVHMTAGASCWD